MRSKSKARFSALASVAFAISVAATPVAFAAPTPTPQVPDRATATPQVPQRQAPTPTPQVPNRQATAVPQPVSQVVPGIQQAAQPLVPQERVVYVESEPVVITETIVETEYVDRQVVEEAGGLLILDPDVQSTIGAAELYNTVSANYHATSGKDRELLNRAGVAAGAGAIAGGTAGAVVGATTAGVGTAISGAALGAAAGTAAQIPAQVSCGVVTVVAPGVGVPCHLIALAAGPTAGASIGAVAGAGIGVGAGAIAGGTAGAAAGAAGGLTFVPGGTEAVQGVVADSAWDLENSARVENGYKPLVGDKPSGAKGNTPVEESTDTRIVDGTVTGEGIDVEPAAPVEPVVDIPEVQAEQLSPMDQLNATAERIQSDIDASATYAQQEISAATADPEGYFNDSVAQAQADAQDTIASAQTALNNAEIPSFL